VAARLGRAECLTALGRESEALRALRDPEDRSFVTAGSRNPERPEPALRGAWRHLCTIGGPTRRETARACLVSGDPTRALAALRAGVEGHDPFVVFVPRDPAFAGLRSHPGFAAILEAAGPTAR
jgi:hypothetical protein